MANGDKETKSTDTTWATIPFGSLFSGIPAGPGGRRGIDYSSPSTPAPIGELTPPLESIIGGRTPLPVSEGVVDPRTAAYLAGTDPTVKIDPTGAGILPTPPVFPSLEGISMGAINNEIASIEEIAFEDRTDDQKIRLNDLYKQKETLQGKGQKGQFSNELLLQMLPQLFSQPFEQSEADRQYAMEMRQYQDQQQRRAAALEQEKLGRQQAFALIPKLFPDLGLDLSSFGGELDPSLIPALIQMAQLKASKQSQRMAQPVVRFA